MLVSNTNVLDTGYAFDLESQCYVGFECNLLVIQSFNLTVLQAKHKVRATYKVVVMDLTIVFVDMMISISVSIGVVAREFQD